MNCFLCYPLSKRYYLLHPWHFISQTFKNIKRAYQRAVRGFADVDCWNLDSYLLEIIPEMVETLRENIHGYPVNERFSSFEDWNKFLLEEIVIPLRNAREDQTTQVNQFDYIFDKYPSKIENHKFIDCTPKELKKKWLDRAKEISDWREEQRLRGFSSLIDETVWDNLWD